MAVRIRLTRTGAKRQPFYRFVVIDSRVQRDGGFLELVGHYNPLIKPFEIKIDEAKLSRWLKRGATMSEGVRSLLKKNGTLARLEAGDAAPAVEASGEVAAEERQEESNP